MGAAELGNVLTIMQIVAILGGGMFFLYRMEGKIQVVTSAQSGFMIRLDKVDIKLDSLTTVIVQLAKQEQRLDSADARLQELTTRIDSITNIYDGPFNSTKVISRKRKN